MDIMEMDMNMDFKIKVLMVLLWLGIIISQGFVKIFKYTYQFLKFLVKIYKLYIYIFLLIPVYIPFHIIDNDIYYQFPSYIIIYNLIILFGSLLYIGRMTELNERKELKKFNNNLNKKYGRYKVDLKTENRSSWNNFNSYRSKPKFSKKEIFEKKKNIRKILKKKELI